LKSCRCCFSAFCPIAPWIGLGDKRLKKAFFSNFSDFATSDEDGNFDILETLELENDSDGTESAESVTSRAQIFREIEKEIQELPARQREAFLMRYWEEFDVAETATAMGCSEGSVKTHCSRAVASLAKALKARGIQL
jgi:RNA polymerase sigma-70 factor (ECF subfamily)